MTPPARLATGLTDCAGVRHGFFTRHGGVSQGVHESLNCAIRSGDSRAAVEENRRRVGSALGAAAVITGYQIHGREVLRVESPDFPIASEQGDALVTRVPGVALGILTADCVPVLLAESEAGVIGAAHAGWRGAAMGITDSVISAMEDWGAQRSRMTACVGPAISAARYEVDEAVHSRFAPKKTPKNPPENSALDFFTATTPGHWLFDLPGRVAAGLRDAGVGRVEQVEACTFGDESFFSRRRSLARGEEHYGCQMSAIVLAEPD